jgi:hypothetical protein
LEQLPAEAPGDRIEGLRSRLSIPKIRVSASQIPEPDILGLVPRLARRPEQPNQRADLLGASAELMTPIVHTRGIAPNSSRVLPTCSMAIRFRSEARDLSKFSLYAIEPSQFLH